MILLFLSNIIFIFLLLRKRNKNKITKFPFIKGNIGDIKKISNSEEMQFFIQKYSYRNFTEVDCEDLSICKINKILPKYYDYDLAGLKALINEMDSDRYGDGSFEINIEDKKQKLNEILKGIKRKKEKIEGNLDINLN